MSIVFVQFADETHETIIMAFSEAQDEALWPNIGEVEDDDPRYLAYVNPPIPVEQLAAEARKTRDDLLRNFCDIGVLMIQRELRMGPTIERKAYLNAKLAEVDQYAVALQNVPEQEGFPTTIIWPVAPTE